MPVMIMPGKTMDKSIICTGFTQRPVGARSFGALPLISAGIISLSHKASKRILQLAQML
jgi:hypothetical protein